MSALISLAIAVPTTNAEHTALADRYDAHAFEHEFAMCNRCGEYEQALLAYTDAQEKAHIENMFHIAHAEHLAYRECVEFEGDKCVTCDEYYNNVLPF